MTAETLNALAKEKAKGSFSLEKQWGLALQRLFSAGLPEGIFLKIAAAASTPQTANRVAKLLSGDARDGVSALFDYCDASHHGLDQWLDALDVLYVWLEKNGRNEPFGKCLGYISCSSESAPEARLPWIVSQMLEQYGMDR
jgi:hypothetical protein